MKRWVAAVLFASGFVTVSFAAGKGPEVDLVDNKLSVSADAIGLGRLLRLLDMATGMKSKVPPELANRNMSVRFSGLNLQDGVRKIFQGQPLDYILIEGQGIVVTAASQAGPGSETVPSYNAGQPPPQQFDQPFAQPFVQDQFQPPVQPVPPPAAIPGQPQQPAMIQTPFGPIANPRAQSPQQILPNGPLSAPGQQNSLFPPQPGQPNGQPQQQTAPFQTTPGNPFGTPSPFGTTNPGTNNPNGLFGSPPVFGNPGVQRNP